MTQTDSISRSRATRAGNAEAATVENGAEPEIDQALPEIDTSNGDLKTLSGLAWSALEARNTPPFLFRHSNQLSRLARSDDDRLVPQPLTATRLRHELARSADWYHGHRRTGLMAPPKDVVDDMLAAAQPPLPVLRGIVASPVFTAEGVLLQRPGYDPASGLYYAPSPGFSLPPVSQAPSKAELAQATNLINNELLGDFPFTGESETATAIAMGLQPFIRDLIEGPTPNYGIEKPTTGTGATLLVGAVLWPALGRDGPALPLPDNEEEVRKMTVASL